MQTIEQRKVIPHPGRRGCWTILIDGGIYGCYDSYAVAVAWALSP